MKRNLVWLLVVTFLVISLFLAFDNTNWTFIDESTYIRSTISIVNGRTCNVANTTLADPTVCNYEHPPLVKLLEAVSLYTFGWGVPKSSYLRPPEVLQNTSSPTGTLVVISYPSGFLGDVSSSPLWFLSFRFFQLVMGALSLVLIYVVALRISGNERLALMSSLLLLLEPLYAFFSRTAYLDIPMVFFALCAYAVFFSSFRLGPINRYWLTGALLGLSALSKESGIVFIVPLVVYHLVFDRTGGRRSTLREIGTILAGEILVTATGLQLYDTLARTPFPTFLNQIQYIASYSSAFICTGTCSRGLGPFAWFTFFLPNYPSMSLSGNQVLLWLIFIWIPLGFYAFWKSRGRQASADDRLFFFAALLFISTFLEDVSFYIAGRTTWIWYFLTVVPSLALGAAYLVTRRELPSWTRILIVGLVFVGCFSAYAIGPNLLKFD